MRLKAFVAGIMLLFVLAPLGLLGDDSWLVMPIIIISYGIGGIILGYISVNGGWRLGLWLVAFWFLMFPIHILLAYPVPWDTKRDLQALLGHAMIIVAACLGTEIGAVIKRNHLKSK